jgi:hypothetical protein
MTEKKLYFTHFTFFPTFSQNKDYYQDKKKSDTRIEAEKVTHEAPTASGIREVEKVLIFK